MTHSTHTPPVFDLALVPGPVAIDAMNWPGDCGAEAVFVGRTREETHPHFGRLLRLEYEVFAPMANKLMLEMCEKAARRWPVRAARLVHTQGAVGIGQASVVIQVATPHRGEGFAACRYLIDTLKHELPIWKREIWERGETFVEGCCAHRDDEHDAHASHDHDHHREAT